MIVEILIKQFNIFLFHKIHKCFALSNVRFFGGQTVGEQHSKIGGFPNPRLWQSTG